MIFVELKTTSSDISPGSLYWERLRLDAQVSHYSLATGMRCLYDVIRKPQIRRRSIAVVDDAGVPVIVDAAGNRAMTKAGEWRRVAGAGTRALTRDETDDEWRERLRHDIAERPEAYYARAMLERTRDELLDAADDVWHTAEQIAAATAWPRHTDACYRYGRMCGFHPVCSRAGSIDDYPRREVNAGLLSTSSLAAFRRCPREYYYTYRLGRATRETSPDLAFGTAMHLAIQTLWRTRSLDAALATVDTPDLEELVRGYANRWPPLAAVDIEVEFTRPITDAYGAESPVFQLHGRIDAIAENAGSDDVGL